MIVPSIMVCSSFLISVCMFIVSKVLLISSDTVIVHAGGAICLNHFAAVVAVTVMRVLLFVLNVCMLRECNGVSVTAMLVGGGCG